MPRGIYERTEEHKRALRNLRRGMKLSQEHKRKIGLAETGEKHHNWKGGRIIDTDGYIRVYCPKHLRAQDNHVYEQVLVWEEYWHGEVPEGYIIHHVDRNKSNNDVCNLALFTHCYHKNIHWQDRIHKRSV